MNLFNQNYHIQIHMCKLQLEKKKQKRNCGVQEGFYGKTIGEYIYIYIYISFKILIIDF